MSKSTFNKDVNLALDLGDVDVNIQKETKESAGEIKKIYLNIHHELRKYINTQAQRSAGSSTFQGYTHQGVFAKKILNQLDNACTTLFEQQSESKNQPDQNSLLEKMKDIVKKILEPAINTANEYEKGKKEPLVKALQACEKIAGIAVTVPETSALLDTLKLGRKS